MLPYSSLRRRVFLQFTFLLYGLWIIFATFKKVKAHSAIYVIMIFEIILGDTVMERNFNLYKRLFLSTFVLSAFTFGGGYVIITLMKKKFVDQYHWIEEKEMLDIVAISQSAPGVIAINASILIGYRVAGVLGSFVTILGTVLPPLIVLTVVSFFYTAFKSNYVVNTVLIGMRAGVAAVIIDVVIKMARKILDEKSIYALVVMILSFIASIFLDINVVLIILVGGLSGLATMYIKNSKIKKTAAAKGNVANNKISSGDEINEIIPSGDEKNENAKENTKEDK